MPAVDLSLTAREVPARAHASISIYRSNSD
jgi:hypothetical protein